MGITLFILIGLLQSCVVASQGCNGFRFYKGEEEVTNFRCTVFKTAQCRNGPSTFPNNLSVGTSVGKPQNFEVSVFRRNCTIPNSDTVLLAPGARFTWEAPLENISREHLKGFYLKQMHVGSSKISCRLIDLQTVDLTASIDYHFSIEVFPYLPTSFETHLAYLTSLPPPSDLEYQGLVEQTVFTIPPKVDEEQEMEEETQMKKRDNANPQVVYPNNWRTWIDLKLHNVEGIVEVSFDYPGNDSEAKFTSYDVQIIESGASNSLYNVVVTKKGSETVGRHNFTNVPSGTYQVQVHPMDPKYQIQGECYCWEPHDILGTQCGTCKISVTQYFSFTNWEGSTFPTSTIPRSTIPRSTIPPSTIPSSTSSIPGEPGDSEAQTQTGTVVVAAVVPVLILVVVAGVLIGLYKRGVLSGFCGGGKDLNENYNANNKHTVVHIVAIDAHDKDMKAPHVSKKKILLLASEDHEFFTQAVEKLASFLEVHCMCDVTFAPQQMAQLHKASNSYCWLSKQIESADFVIIVTSEAAYCLYLAFQEGKGYTKAAWGPEGDLFTPGIQHICGKIANSKDVRSIIRVYFDHTAPSTYRLPIAALSSFHYHLPNHLSTFLHHIHGLDKTRMDLSQVNLPLQGNIKELEGGQEWLDAVQQAEKYERHNPKWFELKFGKPAELFPSSKTKPDYSKQESKESGFTEMRNSKELKRRLSSASNTAKAMVDEGDLGVDNGSFIKDCFSPPSIFTTNTAYTVYPDEDKSSEIDDRSISEEFHKLNQQYEEELQHQMHSLPKEGSAFVGPSHEPQAYLVDGNYASLCLEGEDHDC